MWRSGFEFFKAASRGGKPKRKSNCQNKKMGAASKLEGQQIQKSGNMAENVRQDFFKIKNKSRELPGTRGAGPKSKRRRLSIRLITKKIRKEGRKITLHCARKDKNVNQEARPNHWAGKKKSAETTRNQESSQRSGD